LIVQSNIFKVIKNPKSDLYALSALEWLQKFQRPICIILDGEDTTQIRAVSTLLHGNEPSGFEAILDWLRKDQKPAVNIICFISAVHAALREPYFTNRVDTDGIDLNRVFNAPYISDKGKIAEDILNILKQVAPQCLVDIHNTSGSSPAYAVATKDLEQSRRIASLFIEEYIVFDLKLGTLVEKAAKNYPSIVIECGGAKEPESFLRAQKGIEQYFMAPDLSLLSTNTLVVRQNPIRVELRKSASLYYSDRPTRADITLPLDADKYNSEILKKDMQLAWVESNILDMLEFCNLHDAMSGDDYFYIKDNVLYAMQDLRLYMVTTNIDVAKSDCLFYLMPSS